MSQAGTRRDPVVLFGWLAALGLAVAVRSWNALAGPLFYGYDAWAHISYVFFLDLYHAIPYADQGWSYFQPPLHYAIGWLLAQLESGELLVRGLSVVGSAASLGIAWMAARVTQWGAPRRPLLPYVAFCAVAFLPVHLYVSPMPGNELTATFFSAAVIVLFLRNEVHSPAETALPWKGDLATGVVAGFGMLTKFNVLLAVTAVCSLPLLRWLATEREKRTSIARPACRVLLILGPILLLSGPYYARSVVAYGTPFQLSRDFSPMSEIESSQPPGERSLGDYLAFSPRLLEDARWQAPHMLHAIWPNVYLNMWFDTYREGQLPIARVPSWQPVAQGLSIAMGALGVVPTLLALLGAVLSMRRLARDRGAVVDATMLLLALLSVVAFILFSWRVPSFAALKGSYLLNLSLPYGFFIARSLEAFTHRGWGWASDLGAISVGGAAAAAALVFTSGLLLPMRDHSDQMAAVWAQFSEYEPARQTYLKRYHPEASAGQVVEPLAALELLEGRTVRASTLYRAALAEPARSHPFQANRLAVALALDGDRAGALETLDRALAGGGVAELLVNRGALRVAEGELATGESDLRRAVELDASLPAAWINLSATAASDGRSAESASHLRAAREAERRPPRGFPYGIGNGNLFESGGGQRWMLALDEGEPALYLPPRSRLRSRLRYAPRPTGDGRERTGKGRERR